MSDKTRTDLENALAAHVVDECDELVGSWVMIAETFGIESDPDTSSMWTETEGSAFTTRGLLESQLDRMRNAQKGTKE